MNIIAFAEICKVLTAKSYITTLSESFTKDPEQQDDLYYTGWLAVAEVPGDYTIEAYCEIAYKAMLHKYTLYYLPIPKVCGDGYARQTLDYGVVKTKRIKRYFKRNNRE